MTATNEDTKSSTTRHPVPEIQEVIEDIARMLSDADPFYVRDISSQIIEDIQNPPGSQKWSDLQIAVMEVMPGEPNYFVTIGKCPIPLAAQIQPCGDKSHLSISLPPLASELLSVRVLCHGDQCNDNDLKSAGYTDTVEFSKRCRDDLGVLLAEGGDE